MIMRRLAAIAGFSLAILGTVPVLAVTFGPLEKSGDTTSERKGFYLHLANPYERAFEFRVFTDADDVGLRERIRILPERTWLNPGAKRRILVIAQGLKPQEQLEFRVCAERVTNQKETIHARVCSRLTARRIADSAN